MLQIANYFKGKKTRLNIIIILIIVRMGYVLCLEFSQYLIQFIDVVWLPQRFPFLPVFYISNNKYLIFIVYGIDLITRVFTVFAFMRMCTNIVHQRIIEFMTHLHTSFLEWERYADKIRAYKLMKVAAWGTYSLTLLNVISSLSGIVIQSVALWYILSKVPFLATLASVYTMEYVTLAILVFTSILSILPSILYSIFLVVTWLVFRDKTKVRYSGFRTNDVTREQLLPDKPLFTNQDHLHQIYYKNKNKIHRASYVVLIISASVCFSVFLTPLMIQQPSENVYLIPGEYYMFDNLFSNDCAFVSYQNCSTNFKGLMFHKPIKQSLTTQYNISNSMSTWIPRNSTVSKYCYHSLNGTVIETELRVELDFRSETPLDSSACSGLAKDSSQVMYGIKTSGSYSISELTNDTNFCVLNITRSIDLISDKVPISHLTHTNLADLDAIINEPTTVVDYDTLSYCQFTIVCYYSPVWPILLCIAVFLITLFIQVSLLYCIHRI